jgi:hypothetical protein
MATKNDEISQFEWGKDGLEQSSDRLGWEVNATASSRVLRVGRLIFRKISKLQAFGQAMYTGFYSQLIRA